MSFYFADDYTKADVERERRRLDNLRFRLGRPLIEERHRAFKARALAITKGGVYR